MTVYTIVSYKQEYQYDRYESLYPAAWDIHILEDVDSTIKCILDYKIRAAEGNKSRDGNDDNWEYRLLIDGMDDDFFPESLSYEENEKRREPFWPIEEKARELFDEWLSQAKKREEKNKQEKLAQEKRDQEAASRRVIAAEKKLLQELRAKYEQ